MTFTIEEMKKRFEKFGTIYTPDDVQEDENDIVGLDDIKEMMADFFLSLKKYQEIAPNLQAAKIVPNFTMLLYGPPGTGKTSLTRAMAKKYDIYLGLVEADRLVSPLLGDTVKNIRGAFDLSAEFARENGVFILFFDEIDSIAGERSNSHEVGEIKRAVISFLQNIDKISYEAIPLAIFGATNHQNQLDSAVWRRFTYHLKFEFPNFIVRKNILESFIRRVEKATIGIDPRLTESISQEYDWIFTNYNRKKGKLGRELTENEMDLLFEELKSKNKHGLLYYTQGYTGSDLKRAIRVALFKALQKSMFLYDDLLKSLKLVGGTKTHVIHSQKLAGINGNGTGNDVETSSKESEGNYISKSTKGKSKKASAKSRKQDVDEFENFDIDI